MIPVGQRKNRRVGQPEDHPLHVIVQVFMPVLGNETRVVDNPFLSSKPESVSSNCPVVNSGVLSDSERQIREIFLYRLPHLFPGMRRLM